MQLEITRRAREDMFKIQTTGIAQFGVLQTDKFFDGLTTLFMLIAHSPFIAPERTEFSKPIRLHPYKNLIIAYRIDENVVKVLRVVHGRQDLKRIF
jgi:toxin ParE1/3/4